MTQYSNFVQRNQRNALINGNFLSWPEGLSGFSGSDTAAMTLHGYALDSGVLTPSGTDSTKPNDNCNYVHLVTTTTGESTITGTEHSHVIIRIEGYDFTPFRGKTATLSFWVRASVTGTYCVAFRNGTPDRSYVVEYTINQSNTWEYKTVNVTFDYSGGTWDYSNGVGLQISFTQVCGTTYSTSSTDQWLTGNYIASTNQVNNVATTGNTFYIAQCQLELGNVATEFEHLESSVRARLLSRYYQSMYHTHRMGTQVGGGTGVDYMGFKYIYPMRAIPTITQSGSNIWNPNQGWKAVTSTNFGNAQTFRSMSIFYDSTYASYVNLWALLMYGTTILDARL